MEIDKDFTEIQSLITLSLSIICSDAIVEHENNLV